MFGTSTSKQKHAIGSRSYVVAEITTLLPLRPALYEERSPHEKLHAKHVVAHKDRL